MASTLEEIAKLLPQEQAERFLTLVAHFKNVPDDDEYLQMLEAIGLMTLLWKEVPNEIRSILEKANPVTETCQSIAQQAHEALTEAIPSYKDLKLISKRLEEHEIALKRMIHSEVKPANKSPKITTALVFGFLGAMAGFCAHPYLILYLR